MIVNFKTEIREKIQTISELEDRVDELHNFIAREVSETIRQAKRSVEDNEELDLTINELQYITDKHGSGINKFTSDIIYTAYLLGLGTGLTAEKE